MKPRLTREQLRTRIRERIGVPLSKSWFDKQCSPAIGEGPPVAGYWGNRPVYDEDEGIAWAEARITRTRQQHQRHDTEAEIRAHEERERAAARATAEAG